MSEHRGAGVPTRQEIRADWPGVVEVRSVLPPSARGSSGLVPAAGLAASVATAVDRCGGRDVVNEKIDFLLDWGMPISIAAFGAYESEGRFQSTGFEQIQASLAEGHRVITIVPHMASVSLVPLHFASEGVRSTAFTYAPTTRHNAAVGGHTQMQDIASADGAAPPSFILVPSASAALEAERALRRGDVLLWSPDTQVGFSSVSSYAPFLGRSVPCSSLISKLTRRPSRVFLASPEIVMTPRVGARVSYELLTDEPQAHSSQWFYEQVEAAVLSNIDQWLGWRYFEDFPT